MIGYDYGNARLRSRHAGRLRRTDFQRLLESGGLDQMLGALSASTYAGAVEAAVARYRGLRRLDEAVNSHLAAQTKEVSSFYDDSIRERLGMAGRRWDVRNITALIRAQGSPDGSADLVSRLVPAGRVTRSELGQLAGQPSIRALVDLLLVWRLPDPVTARRMRASMFGVEPAESAVRLEAALFQAFIDQVDDARTDREDDALTEVLEAEVARAVVLGALRLRAARMESHWRRGDTDIASCGSLPTVVLHRVIDSDEPDSVVELLARTPLPGEFEPALTQWSREGDLARLAERMTAAILTMAMRAMLRDPLGIGVPVGYLWLKEQEARNLRLIGRAHAHGLDAAEVAERLVTV